MNLFTIFGHYNWNILIASRVVLLVAVSLVFVWKVTNIDTHLHLHFFVVGGISNVVALCLGRHYHSFIVVKNLSLYSTFQLNSS